MTKGLLFTSVAWLLTGCIIGEEGDYEDEQTSDEVGGPTARFTVVQHNIEKKDGPLATALAAGKDANVITLQEVCPDQLASVTKTVQSRGWTMSSAVVPHAGCPGDLNPSVVAIWTGGSNGEPSKIDQLGSTPMVPGQAACVAFNFKKVRTHVCSVKLISTAKPDGAAETIRRTQTDALKKLAHDNWFNGRGEFGIIAGDFNANTDQKSIDSLYAKQIGGDGDFTEYNRGNGNTRDGRPTAHGTGDEIGNYDKKIDYVFFSTDRVPINNGPAVSITPTGSDHDMVISSAMMSRK